MDNYIFINYQNGNGNVNKQNPKEIEELEERMRILTEEMNDLKAKLFEIISKIEISEKWPQLSSSQFN